MKSFLELFYPPSAQTLAKRELDDAERQLLRAQDASEYAAKMVDYHTARIRRLSKFVKNDQTAALEMA